MIRSELTTLWLRCNYLTCTFCKVVGGGSSSSYRLTDIDLSSNPLGDTGLQHISALLNKCPELRSL
jgi:hypothetical protein